MIAMPIVNPSTTGHGMNDTARPRPNSPMARTMPPAMIATGTTADAPNRATIGSSTTVIAPVGPETWKLDPPKTAATKPATIAVTRPAAAPTPDATPNANASGRATTPTVMPARMSLRYEVDRPA